MFIERPPQIFRRLFPGVLFRKESDENPGVVYLTFDDGPIPEVTPWVLDTLDRFGVKATFFMVGQNIERNPLLFEEVKRRGHKVANHSLHHIRGFNITADDYLKDVDACEKYTQSGIYRPPHGILTPSQRKALQEKYELVMFDLVTRDYSKRVSAKDVFNNIRRYARNGSIIVFHDSLKSFEKLKTALPDSLSFLLSEGFRFALL